MGSNWERLLDGGINLGGSYHDPNAGTSGPYNAGRINDIVQFNEPNKIVATPSSGLWMINLDNGNQYTLPLSRDWDSTNFECIIKGPRGPRDCFAGGITLWQNNYPLNVPAFQEWTQIPLVDLSMNKIYVGMIYEMVVLPHLDGFALVLATTDGLFWSLIPTTLSGTFAFQKATDVSNPPSNVVKFSSVTAADGVNSALVAGAFGDGSVGGLFKGSFTGPDSNTLTIEKITSVPNEIRGSANMFRTMVVSQRNNPTVMYAVIGGGSVEQAGLAIYCVLKSTTGAAGPWTFTGSAVNGMGPKKLFSLGLESSEIVGMLENWSGSIAIGNHDSSKVAIGWESGYFLSTDAGDTWNMIHGADNQLQKDFHCVRFDEEDSTDKSLLVATDGGVFTTKDFGVTHSSNGNIMLSNLEVESFTLNPFDLSHLAGTLRAQRGFFSTLYPTYGHNRLFRDSDGIEPITFLPNGQLLSNNVNMGGTRSTISNVQAMNLDPFVVFPGYTPSPESITLDQGIDRAGHYFRPLAVVHNPDWRNSTNEALIAVSASSTYGVWALFQGPGETTLHWTKLPMSLNLTQVEEITAIACEGGSPIYLGTSQGRVLRASGIYNALMDPWTVTDLLLPPIYEAIKSFAFAGDSRLYVMGERSGASGISRLFFLTRGSDPVAWNQVDPQPGLEPATSFAVDPRSVGTVFISTDTKVFRSIRGQEWEDISSGLPRYPRCTDLKFIQEPCGAQYVYVATYGWSIFKQLQNYGAIEPAYSYATARPAMTSTLNLTIQGNASTDNFPVDTSYLSVREPIAESIRTDSIGDVMYSLCVQFAYRLDDSVEARWDVYLENQQTGKSQRRSGEKITLARGSSLKEDVHLDDGEGNILDWSLLIMN